MLIKTLLLATALLSVPALAHGDDDHHDDGGQMFTPEEFGKLADFAVNQFKADKPDHVSMFSGIALTRNIQDGQEVGVLAKIYMTMSGSTSVLAKYNCHKHETGEIECHAQ